MKRALTAFVLQMVTLGQFRHPRVGQQLPDTLDIDVQFDAERHAFGQSRGGLRRPPGRSIRAFQMVYAILEFKIGRSDFRIALRVPPRVPALHREISASRCDGDQQRRARAAPRRACLDSACLGSAAFIA